MAAIARPRHAACRAGPGARAALRMSPPLPAGYLGPLPGSPTREGPRLTGRWGKRIADQAEKDITLPRRNGRRSAPSTPRANAKGT